MKNMCVFLPNPCKFRLLMLLYLHTLVTTKPCIIYINTIIQLMIFVYRLHALLLDHITHHMHAHCARTACGTHADLLECLVSSILVVYIHSHMQQPANSPTWPYSCKVSIGTL